MLDSGGLLVLPGVHLPKCNWGHLPNDIGVLYCIPEQSKVSSGLLCAFALVPMQYASDKVCGHTNSECNI